MDALWLCLYRGRERVQNSLKKLVLSDKRYVERKFKKRFNRDLNLANPQTYNEILQWRKLYDRNPLYIKCADKYAVRDYVSSRVGKSVLVPLIDVVDSVDDIHWDQLPDSFVIKATHGSGWNLIVRDKAQLDLKRAKLDLRRWLVKNFYYRKREWQYREIKPRLVIEELLMDSDGQIPADYKLHCFNHGREIIVQVDSDRFSDHRQDFFDSEWRHLPFKLHKYENAEVVPEKPQNLDTLLRVSEKLSEDFDYVRVDLYSVEGKVFFGELTFTPTAGLERFSPEAVDAEWGQKILAG